MLFVSSVLVSCGGGSDIASGGGEGGTGLGGSGISYVRGNILEVDGVIIAAVNFQAPGVCSPGSICLETYSFSITVSMMGLLIRDSFAQTVQLSDIVVSGGGKSTQPDRFGNFELAGVTPSDNFVLQFTVQGDPIASIQIGEVSANSSILVKNIRINSNARSANSDSITKEPSPENLNNSNAAPGANGQGNNPNGNANNSQSNAGGNGNNANNANANNSNGNNTNNANGNNANNGNENSGNGNNGQGNNSNAGQGNNDNAGQGNNSNAGKGNSNNNGKKPGIKARESLQKS